MAEWLQGPPLNAEYLAGALSVIRASNQFAKALDDRVFDSMVEQWVEDLAGIPRDFAHEAFVWWRRNEADMPMSANIIKRARERMEDARRRVRLETEAREQSNHFPELSPEELAQRKQVADQLMINHRSIRATKQE